MRAAWTKFVTIMLLAGALSLLGIGAVNYVADPGHIFAPSQYERALADILRQRTNAAGVSNYDDRLLQRYLVDADWPVPDVIALGSSRSYQWRARHFPNQRFFNHSVNGATINDYIAISALYDHLGKWPSTIIIGVDPWIFNRTVTSPWGALSDRYASTASKFSDSLNIRRHRQGFRSKKVIALFSLEYLELSLRAIARGGIETDFRVDFTSIAEDGAEVAVKRFDGSYQYHPDSIKTPEEISRAARIAAEAGETFGMWNFEERDADRVALFKAFLEFLRSEGVSVILFLSPYHPVFYDNIREGSAAARIPEEEAAIRAIAGNLSIPVIGGYDPTPLRCDAEKFLDERHPTEACHDLLLGCRDGNCPPFVVRP